MTTEEIRGKDDADLGLLVDKTRRELFDLRMKMETGEVSNSKIIREKRRDIARIETVLRERFKGIRGAQPHKES